jgi:hypothetical protein
MPRKVRREVRTLRGCVLPKAREVTPEQNEQLDRGAASAFGIGGNKFCPQDESPDPTVAVSALTDAEKDEYLELRDRHSETGCKVHPFSGHSLEELFSSQQSEQDEA